MKILFYNHLQNINKSFYNDYILDFFDNLNYDNICVLFYRSNDKVTESSIASYEDMINKANIILKDNPDIIFLIQSDETEFIELMLSTFKNAIYFKDEIMHINKDNSKSIVHVCTKEENNKFIKNFLAITIIMSRCKYLIFGLHFIVKFSISLSIDIII